MEFKEHYFKEEDAKLFTEECKLLMEQDEMLQLDPVFINKMCNYLEQLFPSYSDFDRRVGNEIRGYVKSDNKQILKIKRKIRDVINKAKEKFLDKVSRSCEKIRVTTIEITPKVQQTPQSPHVRGAIQRDV